MDGQTDGRTYGQMDGISPHPTGLGPLSGLLPKKECISIMDDSLVYFG